MTDAKVPPPAKQTLDLHSSVIDQALMDKLIPGHTGLRLVSLTIWPALAAIYQGRAPMWMTVPPAILLFFGVGALIWNDGDYRRDPRRLAPAQWQRRHGLIIAFTGLAFAGAGMLLTLPGDAERFAVCFIVVFSTVMTPMRAYSMMSYGLQVGVALLGIMAGLLATNEIVPAVMAAALVPYFAAIMFSSRAQVRVQRQQVAMTLAYEDLSARLDATLHDSEASRQSMQSVLDNMTDGVMLYEADGHWSFANRKMAELHALTPEQLAALPTMADIGRFQMARGDLG